MTRTYQPSHARLEGAWRPGLCLCDCPDDGWGAAAPGKRVAKGSKPPQGDAAIDNNQHQQA